MPHIPIMFSTDNAYIRHTATVMASILCNAATDDEFTFYLCISDLNEKNRLNIDALKRIHNFSIQYIEHPKEAERDFIRLKQASQLSINAFTRLYAASLCPASDKVIYLDSDTVVLSSLAPLYAIALGDRYFGMVEVRSPETSCKRLSYEVGYRYYCSGVLLINTKKIRSNPDDYWHCIQEAMERNWYNYIHADQDVINDAFKGYILPISRRWDFFHYPKPGFVDSDTPDNVISRNNPCILHWLSDRKPWTKDCWMPRREEYFHYREKTHWNIQTLCEELGDASVAGPESGRKSGVSQLIPLVFCCDRPSVKFLAVTLCSLLAHKDEHTRYAVFVLNTELREEDERRLRECLKDAAGAVAMTFLSLPDLDGFIASCFSAAVQSRFLSCYKLFLPFLFRRYSKILVLDCGVLVQGDLSALYAVDPGTSLIGATQDLAAISACAAKGGAHGSMRQLPDLSCDGGMNTSVMLFAAQALYEEGIAGQWLNAAKNMRNIENGMQDILNTLCKGRILTLSQIWNSAVPGIHRYKAHERLSPELYEEYRRYTIGRNASVYRFTSIDNLGQAPATTVPMAEAFWDYARTSPFFPDLLESLTQGQVHGEMKVLRSDMSALIHDAAHSNLLWWRHQCYRLLALLWRGPKRDLLVTRRRALGNRRKALRKALSVGTE